MKKILLCLLAGVIIVGAWAFWSSGGTGSVATTNALYEDGTATTTGYFSMATPANQLATSTGWVSTGAAWYLAGTSTVNFPTQGNDSMVVEMCLTSTTTQASVTFDLGYLYDYNASSTLDVFFPETLDTVAANTTHVSVFHTVSFATSTNEYKCKSMVFDLKGKAVKVNFNPDVNVFMWKGFYPNQ